MTVALVPSVLMTAGMQNFTQAFGQVRRPENLCQEQNRAARVLVLRDGQEHTLKHWIGRELFGTGKKPRIDLRVDGPEFRLQARRVAFRVIHQEARIDTEESRQYLASWMRQVRPRRILGLR